MIKGERFLNSISMHENSDPCMTYLTLAPHANKVVDATGAYQEDVDA